MWLNLPELLLRMESVGRWRLSLHWRGRADLRWRCRTSSDWCPASLIRNVIWLKWLEIACICSKFIYFEVKWHYCSLQMWLSKIFHHMKKDSGENKKLVGLGSGRGRGRDKRKSSSSNQMWSWSLCTYVVKIFADRVQGPGWDFQEHKTQLIR